MSHEIPQRVINPIRLGFSWVQERLGRVANRYEEASIEVQPEEHFHYRPLWDSDHELFDPTYSKIRLSDWYRYVDPRQYYYFSYNAARNKTAEQLESVMQWGEQSGPLDRLAPAWRQFVGTTLAPLRHFEYGAHLALVEVSRFAYGSTIEQSAIFSAFDHLANAQAITKLVLRMGGGSAELAEAKRRWLEEAPLQPLRAMLEAILATRDWGEQWFALKVVLSPLLYANLYGGAEAGLRADGHEVLAFWCATRLNWYREDQQWCEALLRCLLEETVHANRPTLHAWFEQWYPAARAAVEALVLSLPPARRVKALSEEDLTPYRELLFAE
ncbi:MAG: phenol 2-monooxygenase [Firmicutes bacterium]|nr:phenol 2-monooxygenase [Bacillota bacterium]